MRGPYPPAMLYVVLLLTQLTLVRASGTLIYKMAESQFNEAAQFSLINTDDERTMGDGAIKYVREPLGKAEDIQVTFPQDGTFRTTVHYDSIAVTGVVELKLHGTSFLDYSTVVMFNNCLYRSEGPVEVVKSVEAINYTSVSIQIGGSCQLRCHDYSVSGLFNRTLGEYASQKDIMERLQNAVCQSYKTTFEIKLKGSPVKQKLGNLKVLVPVKVLDTRAEIINSHIIVTFELSTDESKNSSTPSVSLGQSTKIPRGSHSGQYLFEVWFHVSFLNELLFRHHLAAFTGNMSISLSTLVPYISDKNVQKLRALIPKINTIFPDSKLDVVIDSLSGHSTFSNGHIWVEFNLTGSVTATLNCNPNRTYTVFRFAALMSLPIRNAFDQKIIGFKIETFRGNFTILETQIGKVADRFLSSLFFILPQLFADHHLLETEKHLHGLSIADYIPQGHVLEDGKISLENDFFVVGGRLAAVKHRRKRIPYENLTWIGKLGDLDNYYFPLIDETPENATGLPVQNCTGAGRVKSAAGTLTLTFNMAVVITTCFIGRFLSRVCKYSQI